MSTDYFPPIQRAVQGLSPNNQDTRAALYDKARAALKRQLHAADPALTQGQISRERNLLEDAILRIEEGYDETGPLPEVPAFQPPPAPPPADEPAETARAAGQTKDRLAPAGAERKQEQRRPQAPRRAPSNTNAKRYAIMAVAAALIVGGGAATALYLRGTDAKDGGALQTITAPQTTPAAPAPAKLDDRVGAAPNSPSSPTAPARAAEPDSPTRSIVPLPSRADQAPARGPVAPAPLLPPAQGETTENQRARMLEEDPLAPMRGRVFDGSVNWRTESQASGSNAPLETVIIGDLNIPDRKLRAVLTLRRNNDPAFPAAFLLQVQMTVPPDYPNGNVASLKSISVKPTPQQGGIPLDGVLMKVTTGVFLMGIADPFNEKGRNAKMLQNNQWFDLAFTFDNGRNAVLTFEKGSTGTKAFGEAMAAWNGGTASKP